MPNALVKKYANLTGKSVDEVEKLWDKAKAVASAEGRNEKDDNFYPYVVGILKRFLSINEDIISYGDFKEALLLKDD